MATSTLAGSKTELKKKKQQQQRDLHPLYTIRIHVSQIHPWSMDARIKTVEKYIVIPPGPFAVLLNVAATTQCVAAALCQKVII